MKFIMNNDEWEIIELSQEEMRKHYVDTKWYGEPKEDMRYLGLTFSDEQRIYIDKDINIQQKKKTLKHELMHCYISCYLSNGNTYDEEDLCNISSCSHSIIHDIVEKYFKEKVNDKNKDSKK